MELGALICTPTAPYCPECPLNKRCAANRLKLQDQIPSRPPRAPSVEVREVGVVIQRKSRVLLVQRPPDGRWPGLWEFPHGPLEGRETFDAAARRIMRRAAGLRIRLGPELLTLRHTVTHHRIVLTCFEAGYKGGAFRSDVYTQGRWIELEELTSYPVSAPQRRLAHALVSGVRQPALF
jgi:A/G-specific adenine glycosylase